MIKDGPSAIFFHPDAIEGEGRDLVGRRSAGQSFLRGWLAHAGGDSLQVVVEGKADGAAFDKVARALGETRPIYVTVLKSGAELGKLGTIFFPTPGFHRATWQRLRQGASSCSLVGITHTVSTRRIIEGLHNLLAEPVESWDAIICTSQAVQSVVMGQFEQEAAYFRNRFGAVHMPQPRLPVIPLGVHQADFAPRTGGREAMRKAQGTPDEAVVVMTMGRTSVIEKANPIPMLLALNQAAERTGRDVHLWMAGWASRPEEEALYREAAEALGRRVTVRMLDGRDPDIRRDIWAGADIFTLPSDSIQETFGLVPVEAMAAGLPVVMPDWDGFRDTVLHGETGFLVPTRMALPGTGAEIARRFADGRDGYLQYLSLVQSQVQIDVPRYAEAFETLIRDPELKQRMGARASAHVAQCFDWKAVIPQYLALAEELRKVREEVPPEPGLNPMETDPFVAYRQYPTTTIRPDDLVTLVGRPDAASIDLHDRLSARQLFNRHAVPLEVVLRACDWLERNGPARVAELATGLNVSVNRSMIIVLILAKSDMVRLPPLDVPRPMRS